MKKYLFPFLFSFLITNTNAQMFHENFDPPSLGDSVTTIFNGTHGFDLNSRVQTSLPNSDSAFIDVGDTIILETNSFDLSGSIFAILSFKHICKVDFFDVAVVEVSPDNGSNWFPLTDLEYLTDDIYPPGAPYGAQNNQFHAGSYGTWQPGNPNALPDSSWWKTEVFDASPYLAGFTNAKVRFKLYDSNLPGGNGSAGWFIDDITVNDTTSTFLIGQTFLSGFSFCQLPQNIQINLSAFAFGYNLTDSVNIHIYFGDGTDSIFYVPIQNTQGFGMTISHNYTMPGVFSILTIMTSPDSIVDSVFTYRALLLGTNCDSITGNLFIDYNSDCVFNGSDEPPRWGRVNLYYNNQILKYGWTNAAGFFSFNVPANNYEIKIDTNWLNYYINTLQIACPVSGLYSVSNVPSTGNDFAFECNTGFDLLTSINFWRFRPNQATCQYPLFNSYTCEPVNGQAIFILDPMVTFLSANPVPDSINGDTLIWNFINVNMNNPFSPEVCLIPDSSLTIGDSVCFTSIIEPFVGDSDTLNNIDYDCAEINNSCDPNNKSSSPDGNISPSQELNYIINFQNTGNDTAHNVFILDTINVNLDFNTLRINSASHNMTIDVLAGEILKFNFNNIMLPDSGMNEPASHGFVSYSIKPKANLPNGTQITNTAGIYFDFNLPVVTNTTSNTIDSTLTTGNLTPALSEGEGIKLYPNPANDFIVINSVEPENKKYEITISDVMGKQCIQTPITQLSTKINISNFHNGIYFISIRQNGSSIKNMKLVKY